MAATTYIKDVNITSNGSTTSYLIEPALYGIASTSNSGSSYTVSMPTGFTLIPGATIQVKFTTTNKVNATLNVNSLGATSIYYNSAQIAANTFKANHIYTLVYDNGSWHLTGDIDTNTQLPIGTGANDAAAGNHGHGNITNDGKMAGSTASGDVTTSHKFLREDGVWVIPRYTGIQNNLTSSNNTTESLSAKQGYLLANGSARDDTKLPKITYEYNKEISFGQSGKLLIGKFPCYDSNITIQIFSTTSTTYHAVAIMATQNINTSGGGTITWNTYGDSSNTVTPNLFAKYGSGSNIIEIYFSPSSWSKNVIHISCVALRSEPTNVCENISSIPTEADINPTNTLNSYATNTKVDGLLAAADAMIFKGTLGTGGTITAVPDGTSGKEYQAGYTYKIITAGTYANIVCEVGDLLIAISDSTSGQTAVNNAHWTVAQTNIDGAVTGPSSATSGNIPLFDGDTGKIIKNSSYSPSSFAAASHGLHVPTLLTENSTTYFLRGDNNWSNTLTGNLTVDGLINNWKFTKVTSLNANDVRTTNGLWACQASITNAAHTNHSLLLGVASVGTPFQIQIPDSNVMYIYKRYYSSGTWSGWSKISAGKADNADVATRLSSQDISETTTATNLNDLKDSNFTIYFAGGSNTVTNNPLTNGTAFGLHVYRNASGYRVQDYVSSGGIRLTRIWNNSSWSDWEHIVRSANTATGNSTQPVYIDADGKAQVCTTYANATVAVAGKATNDSDGNAINTTYLKLAGGTMSGQIKTSFQSSVAPGSYCSSQSTVGGLIGEVKFSSGCMGSVNINTAYTLDNVTIPTGWYNFEYIPHRSGGVNGAASGDNCEYGILYLHRMNGSEFQDYVVSFSNNTIKKVQVVSRFCSDITDGQVLISDGTLGRIKTSGYTIAKSVPSNAVFTDHYAWADITGKPDTYPPTIGTTSTTAMAGNTNVNNVTQGTTTTSNWRKVILAGGESQAAATTAVVEKTNQVYQAVGIAAQPSTGTLRATVLQGGSTILTGANIQFAGTKSTNTMIQFLDNTADANGNGIKIGGGGVTVIGSGEAAGNFSPANAGTEVLYLLSDNQIYLETNGQTIANRVGFYISNTNELIPVKAETATNNYGSIGTSSYKWANIYATTFHGALEGNASTASAVAWSGVTGAPGNVTRTTDGFMSKEDKIKLDDMEVIKGTQTGKTGAWTGTSSVITSLYDGLTIKYYLNRDPSGNASLNLTLADGTTTGAIPCYYNSGRLTTHYAVGSVITLTYFNAGSITVNGTATTDNRWIADANYDSGNTNTATRQKVRSTDANYSLLFADPVVGTADNNTNYYTYRNDSIYVNPSTGNVYATAFNGALTGTASNVTTTADTTNTLYLVGVKSDATTTLLHDTAISIQKGKITIGSREVTSGPSSETAIDRIIITPYFHTGGPWKITSSDNSSNAFLKLFYGSSELLKIKHDGTFMSDLKASITGNAATATKANITTTKNGIAYYSNTTGTFANDSHVTHLAHTKVTVGTSATEKFLDGIEITGTAFNTAEDVTSSTTGVLSYGDAGPQIRFADNDQKGTLLFHRWDNGDSSVSFNFLSNQGGSGALVRAGCFMANTRAYIGYNTLDTTYILKVAGASYIGGALTLAGALNTANGTWNKIGDDIQLGDINEAGTLGIQGLNGNTAIRFTTYNQTTKTTGGKIDWNGTKFNISHATSIPTLTLTDTGVNAHLNFSRTGTTTPNYINIPASSALGFSVGGAAGANIQLTIVDGEVRPWVDNDVDLGNASTNWKSTHSKKYVVDEKVTLQWNSTDQSLDFVFA